MEELYKEYENLAHADVSKLSKEKKIDFFEELVDDLDSLMCNENIKMKYYLRLFAIKKELMQKIMNLQIGF